MASAHLRKELECSICLSLYTDPVILTCGHNFCRECISRVLDTQEGSGVYSCPECREEFLKRSPLQRNLALRNIVENFQSTQPDEEDTKIFCTYCIHSPVPAVKSCLLCEASLCENHLRVHSKSPEHVLSSPTTSLEIRKCSVHKKILEYYCNKDAACVCESCKSGEHRGHPTEPLHKAFETKKKKLKNILQELKTQKEEVKKSVQSLQKRQNKLDEQAAGETERVAARFRDIRKQLDDLEKKVLSEISKQVEKLSFSRFIQQLQTKMEKLSNKVLKIEELCNLTDPLTFLQKSNNDDLYDKDRGRYEKPPQGDAQLDVSWVSKTLCTGLSDILGGGVNGSAYTPGPVDILLEEDTANHYLHISDDRRTATKSSYQSRQNTRRRFQNEPQVLSSQTFSSGQHYWDVDVGSSNNWIVGVCYPNAPKKGDQSLIGFNSKSWGLDRRGNEYVVSHNNEYIPLPAVVYSNIIRVYLNYEAGQISFYDLSDPVQHLFTFGAHFHAPLHAAFYVNHGSIFTIK